MSRQEYETGVDLKTWEEKPTQNRKYFNLDKEIKEIFCTLQLIYLLVDISYYQWRFTQLLTSLLSIDRYKYRNERGTLHSVD